jgi:hypothetical protein
VIPPIPPAQNLDNDEISDGSDTPSQYLARNFLDCSYDTNFIADSCHQVGVVSILSMYTSLAVEDPLHSWWLAG